MTRGEDMSTAMVKALVDGLETEGVEQTWAKLNRRNAVDHREEAPLDGMLFYIDPESFVKKKRSRSRRKKPPSGDKQLSLFGDL